MEKILSLDLPVFACLLLVFLLYFIRRNTLKVDYSRILFAIIVLTTLICTSVDLFSWMFNGKAGETALKLNTMFNWLLFITYPMPIIAWILYFEFKVFDDIKRVKKVLPVVIVPYIGVWILVVINFFTSSIFYIDASNHFQPAQYYFLAEILVYVPIILYLFTVLASREKLNSQVLSTIAYFFLIPIVAVLIQVFNKGIAIIWPAMTLVTVVAFILIETDELMRDHLTGLYSKGYFDRTIKNLLRKKQSFSLLMIDLDDFKSINDEYGHVSGDQALIVISSILSSNIKHGDIACRVGGDEFMIVLIDNDQWSYEKVSSRMKEELVNYNRKQLVPYSLSMSVGGYHIDGNKEIKINDLLKNVDAKMYKDKMRHQRIY